MMHNFSFCALELLAKSCSPAQLNEVANVHKLVAYFDSQLVTFLLFLDDHVLDFGIEPQGPAKIVSKVKNFLLKIKTVRV